MEKMYEQVPFTETKCYALCPWCNAKAGPVDHLLNLKTETMWYCDICGESYSLKFDSGKMWIGKVFNRRKDKTLVLLQHGDIGLIVEGLTFTGVSSSADEYFYNEHTCPTNYLNCVKYIIDLKDNDSDPHGIFRYVCTLPYDSHIEDINLSVDELAPLLLSFKKKGVEND